MTLREFDLDTSLPSGFFEFGRSIYANDTQWIPPSARNERSLLDHAQPMFRHTSCRLFVAEERSRIRGRIAAFDSNYAVYNGESVGSLGYFESVPDPAISGALIDRAIEFLADRGVKLVYGPMNGSTWYSYRFSTPISKFDRGSYVGEPYNPDYYPGLFANAGFQPIRTYRSALVTKFGPYIEESSEQVDRFFEAGYSVRRYTRRDIDVISDLANAIFKGNFAFTPCGHNEFRSIHARTLALLPEDHVLIAHGPPGGAPVGFIVNMPDYGDILRDLDGKSGALASVRFWIRRREPKRLIVRTLGALPGLRKVAVGRVLLALTYRMASRIGYESIVHAHMDVQSESIRINAGSSDPGFGRYTLYSKSVG